MESWNTKGDSMKKISCILLGCVLLGACSTGYKRASKATAKGYFDTTMQRGVYDVTFNGNSYTSSKKAYDYALLHASEVCLENGYQSFDIMSKNDDSTTTGYFAPGLSTMAYYKTPKISLMVKCSATQSGAFSAREIKNSLKAKYKLK